MLVFGGEVVYNMNHHNGLAFSRKWQALGAKALIGTSRRWKAPEIRGRRLGAPVASKLLKTPRERAAERNC
ncbi:MAG: hypothetical protein EXR62_17370 [Chloroflexi bacterium]|nr:hypothetical protein [Chloroflexota bacterium]